MAVKTTKSTKCAVTLTSHEKKPKPRSYKLPSASESQILDSILTYLKLCRIFSWRNNNGAVFDPKIGTFRSPPKHSLKGIPDILGILKGGRLLALEVKKQGGRVSPEQSDFIKKAVELGALCAVVYSLDDVIEVLKNA